MRRPETLGQQAVEIRIGGEPAFGPGLAPEGGYIVGINGA